jgi:hypothetical protein
VGASQYRDGALGLGLRRRFPGFVDQRRGARDAHEVIAGPRQVCLKILLLHFGVKEGHILVARYPSPMWMCLREFQTLDLGLTKRILILTPD